jgi:hypothetical protein
MRPQREGVVQDTWVGCYDDSWKGLIVPDAFAHPAKYSRALIQRLYQHAAAEGWVWPGATVLDPFGGPAGGGLDAALAGYRWVGVELEPRFCALGHGFGCGGDIDRHLACANTHEHGPHHVTGNLELWQRRYGHLPHWIAPTLLQGDARQLQAILQGQMDCAMSSPPYAESKVRGGDTIAMVPIGVRWQHGDRIADDGTEHGYGADPANLGNLPPGSFELAISSPLYGADVDRTRPHENKASDGAGGFRNFYSYDPANVGNPQGAHGLDTFWSAAREIVAQLFAVLRPGGTAIWVVKSYVRDGQLVDFPHRWQALCDACGFVTLHEHHALLTTHHGTQMDLLGADVEHKTKRISFFRRLHEAKGGPVIDYETVLCMRKPGVADAEGVACSVSSPPYAESLSTEGNGIDRSKSRIGETRESRGAFQATAYGHTPGQLGALPSGSLDDALGTSWPASCGERATLLA